MNSNSAHLLSKKGRLAKKLESESRKALKTKAFSVLSFLLPLARKAPDFVKNQVLL